MLPMIMAVYPRVITLTCLSRHKLRDSPRLTSPAPTFSYTMLNAQRVALVTGSSSGIGRVTAISLAANGWNVILSGRRESELQETARLCAERAQGGVTTL